MCFLKETQPQMVPGWRSKTWSLQSTRDPSRASARTQQWEGSRGCKRCCGEQRYVQCWGVQTTGEGQTDIQQEQVGQPPTQPGLLLTRARARGAAGNPLHKALTDAPPDPTCSLRTNNRSEGHVRRGDGQAPCLSPPLSLPSSLFPPFSCFYTAEKNVPHIMMIRPTGQVKHDRFHFRAGVRR